MNYLLNYPGMTALLCALAFVETTVAFLALLHDLITTKGAIALLKLYKFLIRNIQ